MAQLGRVRRAGTALFLALSSLVLGACAKQTSTPPAAQPTAAPTETTPLDTFLWGTWYNLEDEDCRYEFGPEGTVTIFTDAEERTAPYRFAGETVTIAQDFDVILRVTTEDGVTHLRRDALELNLVSEADYPAFIPHEVAITMDNWQDFFEVRFFTHVYAIGDEIRYRAFGSGFCLKEEYLDRLPVERGAVDVDVTIQFDTCYYEVETPLSLEYTITDRVYPGIPAKQGVIDKASVQDRRDPTFDPSPHSDLYGQVSAFLGANAGFEVWPTAFYYRIPSNPQVIDVEGTLQLFS